MAITIASSLPIAQVFPVPTDRERQIDQAYYQSTLAAVRLSQIESPTEADLVQVIKSHEAFLNFFRDAEGSPIPVAPQWKDRFLLVLNNLGAYYRELGEVYIRQSAEGADRAASLCDAEECFEKSLTALMRADLALTKAPYAAGDRRDDIQADILKSMALTRAGLGAYYLEINAGEAAVAEFKEQIALMMAYRKRRPGDPNGAFIHHAGLYQLTRATMRRGDLVAANQEVARTIRQMIRRIVPDRMRDIVYANDQQNAARQWKKLVRRQVPLFNTFVALEPDTMTDINAAAGAAILYGIVTSGSLDSLRIDDDGSVNPDLYELALAALQQCMDEDAAATAAALGAFPKLRDQLIEDLSRRQNRKPPRTAPS